VLVLVFPRNATNKWLDAVMCSCGGQIDEEAFVIPTCGTQNNDGGTRLIPTHCAKSLTRFTAWTRVGHDKCRRHRFPWSIYDLWLIFYLQPVSHIRAFGSHESTKRRLTQQLRGSVSLLQIHGSRVLRKRNPYSFVTETNSSSSFLRTRKICSLASLVYLT
jgi:hypothetical protein